MSYESALALSLTPYTAGEQPRDRTFIKLNTNENPYPPSPRAAEAAQAQFELLPRYPDQTAAALREAIARVHGLAPEQVFCGNGSDEVLAFAFAAFFAGKTLAAPDITYSFYPVYAKLFGVDYREVPLHADFTVDVPGLLAQRAPIALANPNAPTSLALPLEELRRMAAHCRELEEVLLVDEAYAAFAREDARPLLDEFDNLLIVRTLSKSHGLAGLRVGYALGSPRLTEALARVKDSFNSYPLDCIAQAAAAAAVLDTAYTAQTVARVTATRDKALEAIRHMGLTVLDSQTNFLFVRGQAEDAAPALAFLRENGILVRRFTAPRLRPWLRITVGTDADMEQVTARLQMCKWKGLL